MSSNYLFFSGSWQKPTAGLGGAATIESRPSQHNFSTVAVVPVSDDVPLTAFTYELYHSLCAIGQYPIRISKCLHSYI